MLRDANRRRFELVVVWLVNRLWVDPCRTSGLSGELRTADIGLFLHQQGLDTTARSGRAIFQMLGVFAGFERTLIRARVAAKLATGTSSPVPFPGRAAVPPSLAQPHRT